MTKLSSQKLKNLECYFLILVHMSIANICCAQIKYKKEEAKQEDIGAMVESFEKRLKSLEKVIDENNDDTKATVGELVLKATQNIQIYNDLNGNTNGDYIAIEKVAIVAKDGYIVEIQVFSPPYVFTNHRSPIELSSSRLSHVDGLKDEQTGKMVYTNEFLSYVKTSDFTSTYNTFILTEEGETFKFKKSTGINNILDLRLYTDLLGLIGDKANGIVQTDAYFKHYLHRVNLANKGIFLCNYLKFNFNISKFDSKVNFVSSENVNQAALIQKSWLSSDLSINLFNGWLAKRSLSSYYLDIGAGFNNTKLALGKDSTNTTSTFVFFEPGINLSISENIGVNIFSRILCHYNYDERIIAQNGSKWFIKPTFELFWNPVNNPASRIFGRILYVSETKTSSLNFFQVQFGYTLKLSNLSKSLK